MIAVPVALSQEHSTYKGGWSQGAVFLVDDARDPLRSRKVQTLPKPAVIQSVTRFEVTSNSRVRIPRWGIKGPFMVWPTLLDSRPKPSHPQMLSRVPHLMNYSRLSLVPGVKFYKVTANTESVNSQPLLLGETEL